MFNKALMIIGLMFCVSNSALAAGGGGGGSDWDRSSSEPAEYNLAVQAIEKENYQKAISLLQTVVNGDPENADAWNYMGYSLRHLKQYDDALAAYGKALELKPKHKGALEYLGELYLKIGQPEEAKAQLKILDKVCFFSCEEYRELKEKIEAYEAS